MVKMLKSTDPKIEESGEIDRQTIGKAEKLGDGKFDKRIPVGRKEMVEALKLAESKIDTNGEMAETAMPAWSAEWRKC